MSLLWSYFWPSFAAAFVIGALAGSRAFRQPQLNARNRLAGEEAAVREWRRKRRIALAAGAFLSLAAAALWHGPLGGAARLHGAIERQARATLDHYEMTQVQARLQQRPLSRRLILSGPADDFQRSELVMMMGRSPGVGSARWTNSGPAMPLFVEAFIAAALGFLAGLLLAYGVEIRRRANAGWRW